MEFGRVDAVAGLVADHEREALAERDVAGGVLVEQRVVEDRVERSDAALGVDQRDLAEAGGALVALADRAHGLVGGVGVDLDRAAALEADAQPAHDRPVRQHERLGRGDVAVDARRIGRGEDLLVGRFGMWTSPSARSKRAACQDVAGSSPTVRSVPGPS